jgi:hypothetical protein
MLMSKFYLLIFFALQCNVQIICIGLPDRAPIYHFPGFLGWTPIHSPINEEKASPPGSLSSIKGSKRLAFLVGVRKGFTKRLKNAAPHHSSFKVLLDGPYDSPPDLRGFDTVILIAGSSLSPTFTIEKFTESVYGKVGPGLRLHFPCYLTSSSEHLYFPPPRNEINAHRLERFVDSRAKCGRGTCRKIIFVWAIRNAGRCCCSIYFRCR